MGTTVRVRLTLSEHADVLWLQGTVSEWLGASLDTGEALSEAAKILRDTPAAAFRPAVEARRVTRRGQRVTFPGSR